MKRFSVALVFLLLLSVPALGADDSTEPDYSKESLLVFFRDADFVIEEPEEEGVDVKPWALTFRDRAFGVIRYLPIMPGISFHDGTYGNASPRQTVDPFHMVGMQFPHNALSMSRGVASGDEYVDPEETLREQWRRKRYRKKMIGFVLQANAAENR